ncbi:MAG TPA: hypothetical protein VE775_04235 [Pyrinomonadaceae bacterium]|nr:hypothetical protein [Pyrinomonadaceae bacterium]
MTNPSAPCCLHHQPEIQLRYQAISHNARYGHYVRIPARICRCLAYFNVGFSHPTVRARLHAYYLFIGVVDDALDAGRLTAGRETLKLLANRRPVFDEATLDSNVKLVTEVLKCHISPEIYPLVLPKFAALYEAVVRERQAETLQAYVTQRRAVGALTAELSYLLVRPLLAGAGDEVCRFLQQVGAVGCLIDSVLDLRADARQGLLGFRPGLLDQLVLARRTFGAGLKLSLKHPHMFGLFLAAVGDDLFDQLRARARAPMSEQADNMRPRDACVAPDQRVPRQPVATYES